MFAEMFDSWPLLISFLAGILTFLSPCVLPLIPAYLSYITGMSISVLSDSDDEKMSFAQRMKILQTSLLFVAGFSLVFIILGAVMANLASDIFQYDWVNYVAGGLIVVFGLHFMGVIQIKFLMYEKRADLTIDSKNKKGIIAKIIKAIFPFLLGVSFALGWTPCIGPIFASIVSLAASEGGANKGLLLMVIYTAGLALPFILSALLTSYALGVFKSIKNHFRKIEIFGGSLLVLIGLAIISGNLGVLTGVLLDTFGQVGV